MLASETLIWGHSQGGHAALWSAQIAPSYAPELDIRGTAALSPASNVLALAEDITPKGPLAGVLMSFVLSAYDRLYDDVRLADYVPTSARRIVREVAARCPSTSAAGPRPDSIVSLLSLIAASRDQPLFDIDFSAGPLADRLAENIPVGTFTQPLLIAHGASDDVVAPSIQDAFGFVAFAELSF
jgi:pimeloyl-ACP methyl ester carboxylesterase